MSIATLLKEHGAMTGFKSVHDIKKEQGIRSRGRRSVSDSRGVSIATDKRIESKGRGYALRLKVGMDLLKEARIIEGDRVDLLFSEDMRAGLIRRSNSDGSIKVCFAKKCKTSASVTTTWVKGLPSVANATGCTKVKVTSDGIYFELPESASFNSNMREPKP